VYTSTERHKCGWPPPLYTLRIQQEKRAIWWLVTIEWPEQATSL